ncbi:MULTISPECIES: hypothetical protein [unclassified Brevibacterium]|uniref:hypothetical protein n=1 Tax=unclassified Brevibacterium TaxID=2614124 RepID=UPI0010FA382C|nr:MULTISPECIES: hypothetical protein [unclassified Brevibacterium]MCM1012481.1 hypothetical protein [Brevibacterium sp. XM4083]
MEKHRDAPDDQPHHDECGPQDRREDDQSEPREGVVECEHLDIEDEAVGSGDHCEDHRRPPDEAGRSGDREDDEDDEEGARAEEEGEQPAPDRLGAGIVSEWLEEEGREDDPPDEDEDGQADAEDPECPRMARG